MILYERSLIIAVHALMLLCLALASGCANQALIDARERYYQGDYQASVDALLDCGAFDTKEKLLCLIEKGTVLHDMGNYEESAGYFLEANRFIQRRDQISVSQQASASIINDAVIVYLGEYSEQLWIHSYLMMNFLHLHDYEAARVEAKQALEVFDDHPEALRKAYFSRALIALCFEIFNQYDDARIEYDIIATQSGDPVKFPETLSEENGEVVLLIATGKSPVKEAQEIVVPPSIKISIPKYKASSKFIVPEVVSTSVPNEKIYRASTHVFEVADNSLDDRMTAIISRQTVRVASKEALAESFGNDALAEFLVRLTLLATEHADVRSWHTLPGALHLVRIPLAPGHHQLKVSFEGNAPVKTIEVDISAGVRVVKSIRLIAKDTD